MIFSGGVSYAGLDRLVVAADVRYVGYSWTEGFGGTPSFRPDGSIGGLGWQNSWAVGLGVQYQLTERLTARAGYTYNQNPIPAAYTFLNIASPGVFQNGLDLGMTFELNQTISLSAAWVHAFSASITGPFLSPAGPLPGTQVQAEQETDSAIVQLTVHY
jgi:long-chain fatty acid transport protein